MKKIHPFLFYYCVIITTILFIVTIFFMPKLQNFVLLLLFLPVTLYFWLSISNPSEVSAAKWSARLLFIVFIFSALGVFAHSLALQSFTRKEATKKSLETTQVIEGLKSEIEKLHTPEDSSEDILQRLDKIKEELADISSQQKIEQTLGLTIDEPDQISLSVDREIDSPLGFVTIKDRAQPTAVYEEASSSSKIVGDFEYNKKYPFFKNEDDWFQILLPNDVEGWVQTQVK